MVMPNIAYIKQLILKPIEKIRQALSSERTRKNFYSYGFIFTSGVVMYFLFLNPPMRLKKDYYPSNFPDATKELNERIYPTQESTFVIKEFDKAVSEIEIRLNHESKWYEIKFLFIGAITLGFITLVYKEELSQEKQGKKPTFLKVLHLPIVILALALSVVVSIMIDMHLRANQRIINMNGIWIAHYVEPMFLGLSVADPMNEKPFYGWESFLRAKIEYQGTKQEAEGASYHNDNMYAISFWPHIFLITILVYLVFMFMLIDAKKNNYYQNTSEKSENAKNIYIIAFLIVHSTIIICTLTTHVVPKAFEVKMFGFGSWKDNSIKVAKYYGLCSIVIFGMSGWSFYIAPSNNSDTNSSPGQNSDGNTP